MHQLGGDAPGRTSPRRDRRFHGRCEQANIDPNLIDFASAFKALADGYELMVSSRRGGAGAAFRLEGRLTLWVNDEWAITDNGRAHLLEGLLGGQVHGR